MASLLSITKKKQETILVFNRARAFHLTLELLNRLFQEREREKERENLIDVARAERRRKRKHISVAHATRHNFFLFL